VIGQKIAARLQAFVFAIISLPISLPARVSKLRVLPARGIIAGPACQLEIHQQPRVFCFGRWRRDPPDLHCEIAAKE
jgi:hypothetical protein